MTAGVYVIENKINGHQYVGSSVNIEKRWKDHIYLLDKKQHTSSHLQYAWIKYGAEAFQFNILEVCDGIKVTLLAREQYYIDTLKPAYNISPTAGSTLGIKFTSEVRAKMSAAKRGTKPSQQCLANSHNPEANAKRSEALKGVKRCAETRVKMSAAQKGRKGTKPSEKTREKLSEALKEYWQMHGCSDETKAKISSAKKGYKYSAEAKANMSAAHQGQKPSPQNIAAAHSPEARAKISEAKKEYWRRKKEAQINLSSCHCEQSVAAE